MKHLFLLPILFILLIALVSFKSAEESAANSSVIQCSDGTVIIPSGVGMTVADQQAMVAIMSSYGSDAGYFVYTNSNNATATYNAPLDASALTNVDNSYGSDLAAALPGSGWTIYKEHLCLSMISKELYRGNTTTISLHDELAPILAKYGYNE